MLGEKRRRAVARAKTFVVGERIEFVRDTDYGRPWEPGTYAKSAASDTNLAMPGWHWVTTIGLSDDHPTMGERLLVPARRIRKLKKES